MNKKVVRSISIDPLIWADLQRLAHIEKRTSSAMAEMILQRYIVSHSKLTGGADNGED